MACSKCLLLCYPVLNKVYHHYLLKNLRTVWLNCKDFPRSLVQTITGTVFFRFFLTLFNFTSINCYSRKLSLQQQPLHDLLTIYSKSNHNTILHAHLYSTYSYKHSFYNIPCWPQKFPSLSHAKVCCPFFSCFCFSGFSLLCYISLTRFMLVFPILWLRTQTRTGPN